MDDFQILRHPRVTIVPAACVPSCDDSDCPYVHSDLYFVDTQGPYTSLDNVRAALEKTA